MPAVATAPVSMITAVSSAHLPMDKMIPLTIPERLAGSRT